MKLQDRLNELDGAGIHVVAISYDSVKTLKEFATQAKISFPLLADPESRVIDAYGIRNTDVAKGSGRDGIPHPGTFLVDSKGIVRAKLFYSVRVRHTPEELLKASREMLTSSP